MSDAPLERVQRLEIDIDTRIMDLWATAYEEGSHIAPKLEADPELREMFGTFLRAAYGKGYTDALVEDADGRRSELQREHGYRQI